MRTSLRLVNGVRRTIIAIAQSLFRLYVSDWAYHFHLNRRNARGHEDWHRARMELGSYATDEEMKARAEQIHHSRRAERELADWVDAERRVSQDYEPEPNFAEVVRWRAYDRYLCRMRHNIPGTDDGDWKQAERDHGLDFDKIANTAHEYSILYKRNGFPADPDRDWLKAQQMLFKEESPPFFP